MADVAFAFGGGFGDVRDLSIDELLRLHKLGIERLKITARRVF
ncbi:hypothetical protein C7450_103183 [Chelatococcus asaccharovorans]|uniref:Uncharacterized protein n=1 Tax=Chelatococcus asaccharovorans TaxID=28210 RepID=A0A2V3UDS4_9HYPH|nr:hypothetical protein C7450_103183 [Chelatococcus asaccharovorans]